VKRLIVVAAGPVRVGAQPILVQDATPPEQSPLVLVFEEMSAVSGAFVGNPNPVRDILGGGLPWAISSATGQLTGDGG
jgi:hypothetical protein